MGACHTKPVVVTSQSRASLDDLLDHKQHTDRQTELHVQANSPTPSHKTQRLRETVMRRSSARTAPQTSSACSAASPSGNPVRTSVTSRLPRVARAVGGGRRLPASANNTASDTVNSSPDSPPLSRSARHPAAGAAKTPKSCHKVGSSLVSRLSRTNRPAESARLGPPPAVSGNTHKQSPSELPTPLLSQSPRGGATSSRSLLTPAAGPVSYSGGAAAPPQPPPQTCDSDIRVGISTGGATIALSVNLSRDGGGGGGAVCPPHVTVSTGGVVASNCGDRCRIRPSDATAAATPPAAAATPPAAAAEGGARGSGCEEAGSGFLTPSCYRYSRGCVTTTLSSLPTPRAVTTPHRHSQTACFLPSSTSSATAATAAAGGGGCLSSTGYVPGPLTYGQGSPVTVRRRVSLWEQRAALCRAQSRVGGGGEVGRTSSVPLTQLRCEMRRLMTRDSATSPLPASRRCQYTDQQQQHEEAMTPWRVAVHDSSTVTDDFTPSRLPKLSSQSPAVGSSSGDRHTMSDSSAPAHYIDDEIDDQPELGVTKMSPLGGAPAVCRQSVAHGWAMGDGAAGGPGGEVSASELTSSHCHSDQSVSELTSEHLLSDRSALCSGYGSLTRIPNKSVGGNKWRAAPDFAAEANSENGAASTTAASSDTHDYMGDTTDDAISTPSAEADMSLRVTTTPNQYSQLSGSWHRQLSQQQQQQQHEYQQQQQQQQHEFQHRRSGGLYRPRTYSSDSTVSSVRSSTPASSVSNISQQQQQQQQQAELPPSLGSTSKLLKPPRRWSGQDEGEWLPVDRDTFMYTSQDFTRVKTMLHKLYRLLQTDGLFNPAEQGLNSPCRLSCVSEGSPFSSLEYKHAEHNAELMRENSELRKQLLATQRELDEKNLHIRQLQQKLNNLTLTAPPSSEYGYNQ